MKRCVFVRNKYIIKTFITSNWCFWLKCASSVHTFASSSEKVISSKSREKYSQIIHCAGNNNKKTFHWMKHYYGLWTRILSRTDGLRSMVLIMHWFPLNTHLFASLDIHFWTWQEWCGLLWCFHQLFGLSSWRHPFTAMDPLVSKWYNATFLQTWFQLRNTLIYVQTARRSE